MSTVLPPRLKNWLRHGTWRWMSPVRRSRNDYATHIPILIGLARYWTIRSVLELGSGYYSTATFLHPKAFPHLEVLHSYETDSKWATRLKNFVNDSRAKMQLVAPPMASALSDINLTDYDVIFVDDSATEHDRVTTIRALTRRQLESLVVIHDFEVPSYIEVARAFRHRYAFKAFNPETGVLWQDDAGHRDALREIDAVIKRHARRVGPDDVEAWVELFSQ
ncbi:MAG TPA: hypothetical protein VIG25_07555 [Pyrinomonadaceae bacterium]